MRLYSLRMQLARLLAALLAACGNAQLLSVSWCANSVAAPGSTALSSLGTYATVSTGAYGNSASCGHYITQYPGWSWDLVCTAFYTEAGYDYVTLRYPASMTGTVLFGPSAGALAPASSPAESYNTAAGLAFVFTSDGSVTYSGVTYSVYSYAQMCAAQSGGVYSLGSVGGLVRGGLYHPGTNYVNSQTCFTALGAPAGAVLVATLVYTNTQACCDFFKVYDNGPTTTYLSTATVLSSSSGSTLGSATATGQYLGLYFYSDSSVVPATDAGVRWSVTVQAVGLGYYRTLTGSTAACPQGYYGATTGLTTAACSGTCNCGTYGGATALTAATCTAACAAGRYGLTGTVRTASTCDGACSAGYYCNAGSCSATQNVCTCTAGYASTATGSAGCAGTGGTCAACAAGT